MADAVSKRKTSGYRARFAVAYALVGAVFVGVIALFAFLVSQNNQAEAQWSGYQPKGDGIERAQAIANHIAPRYRESGQVMAAVALLKHNPKPTREQARLAMSGNLCRCGAYDNYLNAVMRAAAEA